MKKKQDIGQLLCRCFFLLQKDQLRQHESYLGQVDSDLADHTRHPPERGAKVRVIQDYVCLLYTSPSPRDRTRSRMPSSA